MKEEATKEEEDTVKQPPKSKLDIRVHLMCLAAVICLASVCYSNAINLNFVFDDYAAVIRNADTNPEHPLFDLLLNDYWGNNISSPGSHRSYRPLTVLTFRLNRLYAQGWKGNYSGISKETGLFEYFHAPQAIAPSFHAVNVFLHVIVCITLYFMVVQVSSPGDWLAALISSLIFAAHPIHTEAVTGIVGRADLLCAILGMIAYMVYSKGSKIESTHWLYIILSAILIVLSTLCKEVGLMIFAPMAVHEVLLVASSSSTIISLFTIWKNRICNKKHLLHMTSRISILVFTGLAFLQFRKWLTVIFIVPDIRHIENPIPYTHGLNRLYTLGMLHTKYMQLLFAPITLSADWSYNCLPLITTFWSRWNIFSFIMYSTLIIVGIFCVKYLETGRYFLVPLAWLAATFFPSSNLLFFVGTMVGERLLYVPSIGFCVVIGIASSSLLKNKRVLDTIRVTVLLILTVLVLWYSVKTYKRNPDWKSDFSIYSTALKSCPESAKAQMLVGQELQVEGHWKECIPYLQRALEIEPEFCETSYSLGVALYRTGSLLEGLRLIQRGVNCNFTTPNAIRSLFGMYADLMRIYPNEDIVYTGYAELLLKTGRPEDAAASYYTLGKQKWDMDGRNNKELGLRYVTMAANLVPTHCELQYWVGQMNADLGHMETALDYLESASYHHNCSNTYIAAVDKLVGVYQALASRYPEVYGQRQVNFVLRAQLVAQEYYSQQQKQKQQQTTQQQVQVATPTQN